MSATISDMQSSTGRSACIALTLIELLMSSIAVAGPLRNVSTDGPLVRDHATGSARSSSNAQVIPLDYPGAVFTEATGVTAGGTIVGAYDLGDGALHGYFYFQGRFVSFDNPAFPAIEPEGINDRGDVVGGGTDLNFTSIRGWLRITDGGFAPIDFPGAILTEPLGINSRRVIVGVYRDAGRKGHGFVLFNGVFQSFDVPGATFTAAVGINNEGDIVGNYRADGVLHGFLLRNGHFRRIDGPNATYTTAAGITPDGDIAGVYIDSLGHHGYRLSRGTFHTIDGPNALLTEAYGINAPEEVVGIYLDGNGGAHGYLAPASAQDH
jgi:hypothetical protein